MTQRESKTAVVAIGGNSLILDKNKPDMRNQWDAVRETTKHLAYMVEQGWNLVITHGNGPQVGFILRRSELAAPEVHTVPLDIIGADTQGSIGYMLQQALTNELRRRGVNRPVVSVVTQTLVSREDPAFQNPTKPIGGFMEEEEARGFEAEGWNVVEDAGRGWRRVVASPIPQQIVELDAIRQLIASGFIVVAVGGGGIPVVRNEEGELRGVYAVIDKDRASGLLASGIHADLFLISTAVRQVAIHFNKPDQKWLDRMALAEAKRYLADGHFAPGSMAPKIEAVISFLEQGGPHALITDPNNIEEALVGRGGTWVSPT
ncbi:MAG: carbamate kinase [Anaerolineae bacterium]|nr:carbamate kinase [Anaerolineae bacterium]